MISSGRAVLLPRFLDVRLDEVDDAVDERVRRARCSTAASRHGRSLLALGAAALHRRRELHHPLGGVRPAVEDDVLDVLEQILGDVLVDDQLAGVDDPHVHAGLDRVVEKRRSESPRARRRCRGTRTTGC